MLSPSIQPHSDGEKGYNDSAIPYYPKVEIDGHLRFPPPYSQHPLPGIIRIGLIPVGVFAILSVISTTVVISFILWRFFSWKQHYRTFIGYNQYVLLVLNLLLADLQQGASYLLGFHWIRINAIVAPSAPCFAQGWLLHSGDVSSGFFVFAIALHTYYTAVQGKKVAHKTFAVTVTSVWIFTYLLTAVGVILHGETYFVRAGAWCWVSRVYEGDRLALHYIWVFLAQLGTVLTYIATFIQLRRRTGKHFRGCSIERPAQHPHAQVVQAVNRVTMLMTLYPCVYVALTLPLSAGRMWSMAHGGKPYSNRFALVAGSLLASCGWVDSLLYTLTRKRLLQDTMPQSSFRSTGASAGASSAASRIVTDGPERPGFVEIRIHRSWSVTVQTGDTFDLGEVGDKRSRSSSSAVTRRDSADLGVLNVPERVVGGIVAPYPTPAHSLLEYERDRRADEAARHKTEEGA